VLAGTMTTSSCSCHRISDASQIAIFLIAVTIIVCLIVAHHCADHRAVQRRAQRRAPKPGTHLTHLTERYARALQWTISHPWKVAGLIVLTLAASRCR
jgi:multidrug efflux pump subunit AcrB